MIFGHMRVESELVLSLRAGDIRQVEKKARKFLAFAAASGPRHSQKQNRKRIVLVDGRVVVCNIRAQAERASHRIAHFACQTHASRARAAAAATAAAVG